MIKDINILISEPPSIYGFKDVNEVANFISGTHHGIMLSGVLIFAELVNKDGIKSIIITSTSNMKKFMISIIYDNYSMIHSGASSEEIEMNIKSLEGKNLKNTRENLESKFSHF